jgi:DNA (cytosine-5)-methyltransferase 1
MKNEQRTSELHKLRTLHLFAGAGGGILADILLGHHPVCAVEIEPYCQQVLSARQKDGHLPWFPIFDDVQTFDGKPWRGLVDVVAGGFPCQDISAAGKGAGLSGERSGLWKEMARIIGEVGPRFVFVENSPALTVRGLGDVLRDMAEMGYNAKWGVLGARHCGGPVERERIWIACAHESHGQAWLGNCCETEILNRARSECPSFWLQAPSKCFGVEHGLDSYMDQVSAIGNGQVPQVAALAWQVLTNRLHEKSIDT